jgi:hypothetical protein
MEQLGDKAAVTSFGPRWWRVGGRPYVRDLGRSTSPYRYVRGIHRTKLAGLATSAAEREQLGDPKLTRLFRQRFLYETRLELSIALARGKALMIDAARDKLAGITVQRARASPQ